jgi:uncharacterized protein (TIGR03435 family)
MRTTAIVLTFATVIGGVAVGSAQVPAQPPRTPEFEVVSVKPSPPPSPELANSVFGNSFYRIPPVGQVIIRNLPLREIIARAYGIYPALDRYVMIGGPDDILATAFDITAKLPDNAPSGTTLAMLQNLLADRFKLKIRWETRQVPLYVLRVARSDGRLGPDLRPSAHDCPALYAMRRSANDPNPPRDPKGRGLCWGNFDFSPLGPGTMAVRLAGRISTLASRSLQPFLNGPVIDRTGLIGNYEWHFTFSPNSLRGGDAPPVEVAIREQLGLKLERERGPFEVLVVDSVERPTPD